MLDVGGNFSDGYVVETLVKSCVFRYLDPLGLDIKPKNVLAGVWGNLLRANEVVPRIQDGRRL